MSSKLSIRATLDKYDKRSEYHEYDCKLEDFLSVILFQWPSKHMLKLLEQNISHALTTNYTQYMLKFYEARLSPRDISFRSNFCFQPTAIVLLKSHSGTPFGVALVHEPQDAMFEPIQVSFFIVRSRAKRALQKRSNSPNNSSPTLASCYDESSDDMLSDHEDQQNFGIWLNANFAFFADISS